jgi:hypothetical protein
VGLKREGGRRGGEKEGIRKRRKEREKEGEKERKERRKERRGEERRTHLVSFGSPTVKHTLLCRQKNSFICACLAKVEI